MRALMMGLVMFFTVFDVADARPTVRLREMFEEDLFFSRPMPTSGERTSQKAPGVVFRWQRLRWPLSKSGRCFIEIETPEKTIHAVGPQAHVVVKWKFDTYSARCDGNPEWGSFIVWTKTRI